MQRDFVESALHEIAERKREFEAGSRRADKGEVFWLQGPDTQLGAQYKCQIARLIAERICGLSLPAFCEEIVRHHTVNFVPRKSRGVTDPSLPDELASRFTAETYRGWLRPTGRIGPDHESIDYCVDSVLNAVDQLLLSQRLLKPEGSILGLLGDFRDDPRTALNRCLDQLYYRPGAIDFRYIRTRVHGAMPDGPPRGLAQRALGRKYSDLCTALRTARTVRVVGPDYAGKQSLLRRFVREFEDGFETANEARLSICAISLHQTAAGEAVEKIAQFYRDALRLDRPAEGTIDVVTEISQLARQFPAVFVIAGLDAIDGDEIMRALHHDAVGEAIASILNGHPETRLLASMSGSQGRDVGGGDPLGSGPTINLGDLGVPAANYRYRALRQSAEALAARRPDAAPRGLPAELGDGWVTDAALHGEAVPQGHLDRLARFICDVLLDARERGCLGIVALSQDGMMPDSATRIFAALRAAHPGDPLWSVDPLPILSAMPREVVRSASASDDSPEGSYVVERALRETLLRTWSLESASQVRAANWGIARAAADHARRLRAWGGPEASAGRDAQVLTHLLASVDPSGLRSDAHREPLEHVVIPRLANTGATPPEPRAVVEFAYGMLFRRDFAASAAAGINAVADPRLRLAVVQPFLDNRETWCGAAQRNDPARWCLDTGHAPWTVLGVGERLELLLFAASSAVRLNLWRVVTAVARVAEELMNDVVPTGRQLELLGRIQRYELDFGILLGRNPDTLDSLASPGWQGSEFSLKAVTERVGELLYALTVHTRTRTWELERQKFQARQAELMHLGGQHEAAYWAFVDAARSSAGGQSRSTLTNLTGRSRRMFTRLLIEMGRGKLYDPSRATKVRYRDGLELPIPDRTQPTPSRLVHAGRLVDETLRSINRGSVNDWLGLKIDQARLHAVQLDFATALRFLDQARRLARTPTASRDIVLEYLSVQGRTLADAAATAMAVAGMPASDIRSSNEPDLARLGTYLGIEAGEDRPLGWRHGVRISDGLCARADECLSVLREMVVLPGGVSSRYVVFADYLGVWLSVVRSRQTIDTANSDDVAPNVYGQLLDAGQRFELVLKSMVRSGYLMSRREAELLCDALLGAGVVVTVPDGFPSTQPQPRDLEPT